MKVRLTNVDFNEDDEITLRELGYSVVDIVDVINGEIPAKTYAIKTGVEQIFTGEMVELRWPEYEVLVND